MGSIGRQKDLEWLLHRFEKVAAGPMQSVGLLGPLL